MQFLVPNSAESLSMLLSVILGTIFGFSSHPNWNLHWKAVKHVEPLELSTPGIHGFWLAIRQVSSMIHSLILPMASCFTASWTKQSGVKRTRNGGISQGEGTVMYCIYIMILINLCFISIRNSMIINGYNYTICIYMSICICIYIYHIYIYIHYIYIYIYTHTCYMYMYIYIHMYILGYAGDTIQCRNVGL